jgi:hypothetical protein
MRASRQLVGVGVCSRSGTALSRVIVAYAGLLAPFLTPERAVAGPASPPPASAGELKRAARQVESAEAKALDAQQKVDALAKEAVALAAQHRTLVDAVKKAKAELARHLRAGQQAYSLPPAPAKPSKKPPPLPKLKALKTGKTEYAEVLSLSAAATKAYAALSENEAALEQRAEAAGDVSNSNDAALKDAQTAAVTMKTAAAAKDAPPPFKTAAQDAANKLKNARAAATAAMALSRKARTSSGFASPKAYATRVASLAKEREQLQKSQQLADVTLKDVVARLALQNPPVPGCDLRKVPWRDMAYPWVPQGDSWAPLRLHGGAPVCESANKDECPYTPSLGDVSDGADSVLTLGDLDGDGKPEAALHLLEACCDVSSVAVLFFKQDAECHLEFLSSIDLINSSGSILGGAFVADMPFARPGENIGLGAVSGREHAEWRLVQGQLRKTKSVKTTVKLDQ